MTLPTLDELIQWYSRTLPPAPCDCVQVIDGHYVSRCTCMNSGDAETMAIWCDEKNREPIRLSTLSHLEQFANFLNGSAPPTNTEPSEE